MSNTNMRCGYQVTAYPTRPGSGDPPMVVIQQMGDYSRGHLTPDEARSLAILLTDMAGKAEGKP